VGVNMSIKQEKKRVLERRESHPARPLDVSSLPLFVFLHYFNKFFILFLQNMDAYTDFEFHKEFVVCCGHIILTEKKRVFTTNEFRKLNNGL
jgi:hypothetical protein